MTSRGDPRSRGLAVDVRRSRSTCAAGREHARRRRRRIPPLGPWVPRIKRGLALRRFGVRRVHKHPTIKYGTVGVNHRTHIPRAYLALNSVTASLMGWSQYGKLPSLHDKFSCAATGEGHVGMRTNSPSDGSKAKRWTDWPLKHSTNCRGVVRQAGRDDVLPTLRTSATLPLARRLSRRRRRWCPSRHYNQCSTTHRAGQNHAKIYQRPSGTTPLLVLFAHQNAARAALQESVHEDVVRQTSSFFWSSPLPVLVPAMPNSCDARLRAGSDVALQANAIWLMSTVSSHL